MTNQEVGVPHTDRARRCDASSSDGFSPSSSSPPRGNPLLSAAFLFHARFALFRCRTRCDRESRAILSSRFPLLDIFLHLFLRSRDETIRPDRFYSLFFPSYTMRLQANLLTTIFIVKSQRFDLGRGGRLSLSLSPRLNCIDSAEKRAIQRERSLDSRYRLSV